MISFPVRRAERKDIPHLEMVERSAATAFSIYPGYSPDWPTVPTEKMLEMLDEQMLWVATRAPDFPIGFAGCRKMDDLLYVHEISVAADFQQKGIGRRLMQTIIGYAHDRHYRAVGLTTARDVAWNMPFYKTLDFHEMATPEESGMLWEQLQTEIGEGADPARRCAMIRSSSRA